MMTAFTSGMNNGTIESGSLNIGNQNNNNAYINVNSGATENTEIQNCNPTEETKVPDLGGASCIKSGLSSKRGREPKTPTKNITREEETPTKERRHKTRVIPLPPVDNDISQISTNLFNAPSHDNSNNSSNDNHDGTTNSQLPAQNSNNEHA